MALIRQETSEVFETCRIPHKQRGSGRGDHLGDTVNFMGAEVVTDDQIARSEFGSKDFAQTGEESRSDGAARFESPSAYRPRPKESRSTSTHKKAPDV